MSVYEASDEKDCVCLSITNCAIQLDVSQMHHVWITSRLKQGKGNPAFPQTPMPSTSSRASFSFSDFQVFKEFGQIFRLRST